MGNVSNGLNSLLTICIWLLVAGFVCLVLIMVGSNLNRQRLLRKTWQVISGEDAHALQADLLDYIKFNSRNQRSRVGTSTFWRENRTPQYVRSTLIKQLTDARIVTAEPRVTGSGFWEFLNQAWVDFFCLPPTVLVLSDEDWLLMVNSKMTGQGILIERFIMTVDSHDVKNVIKTRSGSVTGVAQAGRDAKVGDIGQRGLASDLDALGRLVDGLKADASLAADPAIAKRISTVANALEEEIEEPTAADSRQNVLDRVTALIDKYGDALATTTRILGSFVNTD